MKKLSVHTVNINTVFGQTIKEAMIGKCTFPFDVQYKYATTLSSHNSLPTGSLSPFSSWRAKQACEGMGRTFSPSAVSSQNCWLRRHIAACPNPHYKLTLEGMFKG